MQPQVYLSARVRHMLGLLSQVSKELIDAMVEGER